MSEESPCYRANCVPSPNPHLQNPKGNATWPWDRGQGDSSVGNAKGCQQPPACHANLDCTCPHVLKGLWLPGGEQPPVSVLLLCCGPAAGPEGQGQVATCLRPIGMARHPPYLCVDVTVYTQISTTAPSSRVCTARGCSPTETSIPTEMS